MASDVGAGAGDHPGQLVLTGEEKIILEQLKAREQRDAFEDERRQRYKKAEENIFVYVSLKGVGANEQQEHYQKCLKEYCSSLGPPIDPIVTYLKKRQKGHVKRPPLTTVLAMSPLASNGKMIEVYDTTRDLRLMDTEAIRGPAYQRYLKREYERPSSEMVKVVKELRKELRMETLAAKYKSLLGDSDDGYGPHETATAILVDGGSNSGSRGGGRVNDGGGAVYAGGGSFIPGTGGSGGGSSSGGGGHPAASIASGTVMGIRFDGSDKVDKSQPMRKKKPPDLRRYPWKPGDAMPPSTASKDVLCAQGPAWERALNRNGGDGGEDNNKGGNRQRPHTSQGIRGEKRNLLRGGGGGGCGGGKDIRHLVTVMSDDDILKCGRGGTSTLRALTAVRKQEQLEAAARFAVKQGLTDHQKRKWMRNKKEKEGGGGGQGADKKKENDLENQEKKQKNGHVSKRKGQINVNGQQMKQQQQQVGRYDDDDDDGDADEDLRHHEAVTRGQKRYSDQRNWLEMEQEVMNILLGRSSANDNTDLDSIAASSLTGGEQHLVQLQQQLQFQEQLQLEVQEQLDHEALSTRDDGLNAQHPGTGGGGGDGDGEGGGARRRSLLRNGLIFSMRRSSAGDKGEGEADRLRMRRPSTTGAVSSRSNLKRHAWSSVTTAAERANKMNESMAKTNLSQHARLMLVGLGGGDKRRKQGGQAASIAADGGYTQEDFVTAAAHGNIKECEAALAYGAGVTVDGIHKSNGHSALYAVVLQLLILGERHRQLNRDRRRQELSGPNLALTSLQPPARVLQSPQNLARRTRNSGAGSEAYPDSVDAVSSPSPPRRKSSSSALLLEHYSDPGPASMSDARSSYDHGAEDSGGDGGGGGGGDSGGGESIGGLTAHEVAEYLKERHEVLRRREAAYLKERCKLEKMISYLLKDNDADVNAEQHTGAEKTRTHNLLHRTAAVGNARVMLWLVKEGCDVNKRDVQGVTPLMVAARHGLMREIVILLGAGADLHATDKFGYTALHHAARGAGAATVRTLLMAGAEKNACDIGGHRPIDLAREFKRKATIDTLNLFADKRLSGKAFLDYLDGVEEERSKAKSKSRQQRKGEGKQSKKWDGYFIHHSPFINGKGSNQSVA